MACAMLDRLVAAPPSGGARCGRYHQGRQRIRSEPIRSVGAFGHVPDQENDPADQQDENKQVPPTRAIAIVQAPDSD